MTKYLLLLATLISTVALGAPNALQEIHQIQNTIRITVENAIREHIIEGATLSEAREVLTEQVERQFSKADPQIKNFLLRVAHDAIASNPIQKSSSLYGVNYTLSELEYFQTRLQDQKDVQLQLDPPLGPRLDSSVQKGRSSGYLENMTGQEIASELINGQQQFTPRVFPSATIQIETQRREATKQKFSAKLSMEFLGAKVGAGPTVQFEQSFVTYAMITTNNQDDVIDNEGKVIFYNHDGSRRRVLVQCLAESVVKSIFEGSGGVTYAGVGGEIAALAEFKDEVSIKSIYFPLPLQINGLQTHVSQISGLCHNLFLGAVNTYTGLTVEETLKLEAKDLANNLVYRHPSTLCATDDHCRQWTLSQRGVWGRNIQGKCVETDQKEAIYQCRAFGREGFDCPVYINGKLKSTKFFELPCADGLRCVVTQEGNPWLLRPWKGKCRR